MSFKERNEDYRALEERGCVKIIFCVVTTGLRLRIESGAFLTRDWSIGLGQECGRFIGCGRP
jgi:hypothetical protein